jgi:hypothetical protein
VDRAALVHHPVQQKAKSHGKIPENREETLTLPKTNNKLQFSLTNVLFSTVSLRTLEEERHFQQPTLDIGKSGLTKKSD